MNDDLEITYTTSRVDQDCRCCRCGDDDTIANMLKVVWGNDMTVSIKLAVKEDDQYVDYDLTDVEDMVVNVVSPYQDRIQVDSFITANKIQAIIDSNVLEANVPYGIELVWKDGPYDKRAYAKNMFMFVNSSIEATDSAYRYDPQNPYEYNIIMENDTCYISIGQIPEVDMSNYVTQGELTSYLDALWQDCNDTFVDHEELADAISDLDLSYYVTQVSLSSNSYVTQSSLNEMSYVTESSLNTTLSGYVSSQELDTTLENASYVTYTDLQDAIAGVTIDESNLVHKTGTETITGQKMFDAPVSILNNKPLLVYGGVIDSFHSTLLPSVNLFGSSTTVNLKAGRGSLPQLATGEIIAPYSDYDVSSTNVHSKKDEISFKKITQTSSFDPQFSTLAKINSYGIYEGTTLLEDKYMQIANMPSIPAYTSDLVNDSGFLTQSDIDNMSYVTYNEVEQILEDSSYATQSYVTEAISQIPQPDLSSYVTKSEMDATLATYVTYTYLDEVISNLPLPDLSSYVTMTYLDDNYVSYNELNNYTEAISTALTYQRVDINNTYGYFRNYYTKTESDSRYVTPSQVATNYVDNDSLNNLAYGTSAALNELNDRVTYIEEQGGTTPDLSSYVTYTYLEANYPNNTYLEANYPDYAYLEDALSNISPSVDLSTYVSYVDWDNSNEAVAYFIKEQALFNNNVYDKTTIDTMMSQYATQQDITSALGDYVSTSVNEQQNKAIAYAISYLNDNIGQGGGTTPDLSSYVTYTYLEANYPDYSYLESYYISMETSHGFVQTVPTSGDPMSVPFIVTMSYAEYQNMNISDWPTNTLFILT